MNTYHALTQPTEQAADRLTIIIAPVNARVGFYQGVLLSYGEGQSALKEQK